MAGSSTTIRADGQGLFDVTGGGRVGHALNFDEMLAAVISLTHPLIRTVHPTLTGVATAEGADSEPRVVVSLSIEEAQRASEAMADLLCWVRGFRAARPDDHDTSPLGVEGFRNLRIKLRLAISDATGRDLGAELPF